MSSSGYTNTCSAGYFADLNLPTSVLFKGQAQNPLFDLTPGNSDRLHPADHKDYQLLYEYEKKHELKSIILLYQHPTNHDTKIIEIPTETSGKKESSGQGGSQQQKTTHTHQRQSGVASTSSSSYTSSGASSAGGDAPPPPGSNRGQPTNSHYDENVGVFGWFIALFNYWWMTRITDQAASRLVEQVPENRLTHWMSEHETLTGGGFVIAGITASYAIGRSVGSFSLSQRAYQALIYGTGIHVINWFSPEVFAMISQYSPSVLLSYFGYRFGNSFSRGLRARFSLQIQSAAYPPPLTENPDHPEPSDE